MALLAEEGRLSFCVAMSTHRHVRFVHVYPGEACSLKPVRSRPCQLSSVLRCSELALGSDAHNLLLLRHPCLVETFQLFARICFNTLLVKMRLDFGEVDQRFLYLDVFVVVYKAVFNFLLRYFLLH